MPILFVWAGIFLRKGLPFHGSRGYGEINMQNATRQIGGREIIDGWLQMSGRRMSGNSRPSLGAQVFAVFSFIAKGKSLFKKCLGKRLEVPDILLPDIHGLLIQGGRFLIKLLHSGKQVVAKLHGNKSAFLSSTELYLESPFCVS